MHRESLLSELVSGRDHITRCPLLVRETHTYPMHCSCWSKEGETAQFLKHKEDDLNDLRSSPEHLIAKTSDLVGGFTYRVCTNY